MYAHPAGADAPRPAVRHAPSRLLARLPYWLLLAIAIAVVLMWRISTDDTYTLIFTAVVAGVGMTLLVTVVAYAGALFVGLVIQLLRLTRVPCEQRLYFQQLELRALDFQTFS